jgi:hypothetical protein
MSFLSISVPVTARTLNAALTTAPQNLRVTGTSLNIAHITWDALQGANSYRVYRSTNADSGFVQVGTPTAPGFTDVNLQGSTTYWYRVSGVNVEGEGPQSTSVSATTQNGPFTTVQQVVDFLKLLPDNSASTPYPLSVNINLQTDWQPLITGMRNLEIGFKFVVLDLSGSTGNSTQNRVDNSGYARIISVTLPSTLTSLGAFAFQGILLTSVPYQTA